MCSGKAAHAPRFVRCQSIRQRPLAIGAQNSFVTGVARAIQMLSGLLLSGSK
jgi:hypothetical protein